LELIDRYANNEYFTADSIHFDDSQKFTTPGGRTVYGGGGIMPDIFVPLDTIGITPYYNKVWNTNTLYRYTLDYADRHRREINAIGSIDELNAFLDGDRRLVEDFVAYAESVGLKPNWREIKTSRRLLNSLLRAYIGRNTSLEDVGYSSQIVPIDETLQKAFEVLGGQKD
jgi:carboxyl-terminal processing protease